MKKILTLCMVENGTQILLGMKKRGFGEGLWNGFGGKVEDGESIIEAAKRELTEEVGLNAEKLNLLGVLTFTFESDPKELEVHVFRVTTFSGEPVETDEMRPAWFLHQEIPLNSMWASDGYWLPALLRGESFKGQFHFDAPATLDHKASILSYTFELTNR